MKPALRVAVLLLLVALIAPVLASACSGKLEPPLASVRISDKRFTAEPQMFLDWLGR